VLLVLFKKLFGKGQTQDEQQNQSSPERQVERIQGGDLLLRNEFITAYQPFIVKAASRFCKRYIDPSRDDEFSVALNAFNEAIDGFSASAGRSFLGFAETVIRRRLIDHVRKEQRFSQQVPYSAFDHEDEEDNIVNPVETHQAMEQFKKDQLADERRTEILELNEQLREFGISFVDLVEASPKHADSRETLFSISRILSKDEVLMHMVRTKKMLPIKELMERVHVSRKTLERNRKYIIAVALIHGGAFPHLQQYVHRTAGVEVDSERRRNG